MVIATHPITNISPTVRTTQHEWSVLKVVKKAHSCYMDQTVSEFLVQKLDL